MALGGSGAAGLRRLLIDYDSTLNPCQGNAPLTTERAELLKRFLERWRGAGVQLYVLTSSSTSKKSAALCEAGLLELFAAVLSSTEPKHFKTKGDYLFQRLKQDGWQPLEQLLADDAIEAVQSIWQDTEGEARECGALAHTLRLPQHSNVGLTEDDLQLLDARVFAPASSCMWHAFVAEHGGQRFVDVGDSVEKCMLDTLPEEARTEVLGGSQPERKRNWLQGRPDAAALLRFSPLPSAQPAEPAAAIAVSAPPPAATATAALLPAPAAAVAPAAAATPALTAAVAPVAAAKPVPTPKGGKGGPPKGKAGVPKGPPPPKPRGAPKAKAAAEPSKAGVCGIAQLLQKVEAMGKRKDEEEAVQIDDVDLSQIDKSARRERVICPRCQKEVLREHMDSHKNSHSSEILPWLFLGGERNAENDTELTVRTGITHILNVAQECSMWDQVQKKVEAYNIEHGLGFAYKKVSMVDLPSQDILAQIDEALSFIHESHQADSRHHVLVHCVQGISRSASVVVAYLMRHEGMRLRDAHAHVLHCRAIAMPRREFVDQLGRLECQLFGCDTPSLTSEEVFADKDMLKIDGATAPVAQSSDQEAAESQQRLGFLPPLQISAAGKPAPAAGKGKGKGPGMGRGKGPPPPKLSPAVPTRELRETAEGAAEGAEPTPSAGKAKGKGPSRAPPSLKGSPAAPCGPPMATSEGGEAVPAAGKCPGKVPPPQKSSSAPSAGAPTAAVGKGKVAGKGSGNGPVKANAVKRRRLSLVEAPMIMAAQDGDGSFPAAKCAARLEQLSRKGGEALQVDFEAKLSEPGSAFSTFFVLELFQRFLDLTCRTVPDDRLQTVLDALACKNNPSCGPKWREKAFEWLALQEVPKFFASRASTLIDEWFNTSLVVARSKGSGLSEEQRRQREEDQRRRSEKAREREAAQAAHWRSLRACSVEAVAWSSVKQTMWCSGGMGGAILVQLGGSEAVVVKPQGLSAVAEAVAAEVAELIDVRVARVRPLPMVSEEYFAMAEALLSVPAMVEGQRDFIQHMLSTSREFVAVVEFVPGIVLQGLPGQQALGQGPQQLLQGLGELIALDCLLNNVDRVPAIWQNEGNLSNVLIVSGSVVGIDQQVNPITDPAGSQRFLDTLSAFCQDVFRVRTSAAAVARVRSALELNCGFNLSEEAAAWLLAGVASGFRTIAERRAALEEALPRIGAKMMAVYGVGCADVGLSRLDSMLDFLRSSIAEIARSAEADVQGAGPADPGARPVVQAWAEEATDLGWRIQDMRVEGLLGGA